MKRTLFVSRLILPLALGSAHLLSAQSLVLDKTTLNFFGQVGGAPVSQTLNITSSDGTSTLPFTLSFPTYPWLKVEGVSFGYNATTPRTVTVTADPAGMTAGVLKGSIVVQGGATQINPIDVNFTVSAIGVSPSSLSFTYTKGGALPNSQALTLTGGPLGCTTTTSGTWFTLQQVACQSPGTITVIIQPDSQNLAPDTYNGSITITPSSGTSPAIMVPLKLTVLPNPAVTVNPKSVVIKYQSGIGAANPSRTFTVSAAGSSVLSYGINQTGEFTGISTINPSSGTIGTAVITYTVNPTSLTAGTHSGQLQVSTPGGSPTVTVVPVSVEVSPNPQLIVPNAKLSFSYQIGAAKPAEQTVDITATSGAISYAVSQTANTPWLTVPLAGTTGTPLSVKADPAGLAPGTYTATITVTPATGGTSQSFDVELKVANDPAINASVGKLNFAYQIGQAVPGAQAIKLTSSTGTPLSYTAAVATTACGSTWLLLNGTSNNVTGATGSDTPLTISVATAGLVAGTCDGSITVSATNPATGAAAVNSPLTIPVKLYVSPTALLVVDPPNPTSFIAGPGNNPAPQTYKLSSTNGDVLVYGVAIQPSNSWLSVNTQGGPTPGSLTLSVNAAGLAPDTYTGKVTVTATLNGVAVANSPFEIPVTLIVSPGNLVLSSSALSFEQTPGAAAPASQTVTVTSNGLPLAYTAVASVTNSTVNWLAVTPAGGNTTGSGTLTVSVDASKLTPGTYDGRILVSSLLAGNSPQTISVKLKVNPGTISAPTTTLTFTQAAGGTAPAAQTIAVASTPAGLNFTAAGSVTGGGSWLAVTPPSGTTPGSVSVTVNAGALAVNQYTGKVIITSPGAVGSPIEVPVILNVVPAAVLATAPTSLNFAYTIGQAAGAAQSLSISATGTTATVPFTTQLQYDGPANQWLAVNPAAGNVPATLQVSISPAGLTAGTYNARIVISSSNALASLTVPVKLIVTAIPKPVVVAVKNAASYSSGAVSPGENIVIGGSGIGPNDITVATPAADAYPTILGATRVLFDNFPAPIIYVSATQTSVMVPYGVSGRATTSMVVEYSGVTSDPLTYNVAQAAPGMYTLNSQGTGPGAILNQNLAVNGPNTPEKRGNVIAIYMTGEGDTNPRDLDGSVIQPIAAALKKPVLPVTVTIGGVDARVEYAGSAPGLISGVMQVNVTIPATAPTGSSVPVVVTVGTAQTQSGASAATVAISAN